jgi:cell division septation protein DedD
VIELERHIEILLLSNDCVIVPDLGGFMAHHIEARYDEEDKMFLPPQRTLGFNPQLKLNDSLLAQSYVEAYDISYPEAVRRIEAEVVELKQHLENEGYYELNDIGMLKVNDEGKLEFTPCEAGILTPELYGLSSFEMKPIKEAVKPAVVVRLKEEEPSEERAITVKMSWIRNTVAVAAALLAFFLMTKPVSNSEQPGMMMSQINLPIMPAEPAKATLKLERNVATEDLQNSDITPEAPAVKEEPAEPEPQAVTPVEPAEPVEQANYCIVVASQVSQKGADAFVTQLRKKGFSDARVYIYNKIRRVVCGSFQTEAEAYRRLQSVHQDAELAEAWVFKIKH